MAVSLESVAQLSNPTTLSPERMKAAEAFESYMVSYLAQQMRESIPDGPMSQGPMATFAGLFDQEIGRRVAEGGGLGLKAELEQSFARADLSISSASTPTPSGANASMVAALRRYQPGATSSGPVAPHLPTAPRSGPLAPGDAMDGRISSHFGTRSDPFTKETRSHKGTDFAAPEGTSIRAAAAGIVRFAGQKSGYGNVVIVDHPDGSQTRYAHCSELRVEAGQHVARDTELATVGHTGRATGPHLHFEVRQNGVAVDPEAWLKGR